GLGQLLVTEGLITEEQLARALGELKTSGERLGSVLVRLDLVNEVRLAQFLGRVHRVAVVTLDQPIDAEVLALVPSSIARKHDVIPTEWTQDALTLAMADPLTLPALDDITFLTGLRVTPAVAPLSVIRQALERSYESRPADLLGSEEADAIELEILDSN